MTPAVAAASEFLGPLSDADKARFLTSIDLYVAPNTGGESFGIILVEAMAAGAPVLASDLPAFVRVLGEGAGRLFRNENATALGALGSPACSATMRNGCASRRRLPPGLGFRLVGGRQGHLAVYDTVTPMGIRSRAWSR